MTGTSATRGPGLEIVLRDGTSVHIRPVRATDREGIRAFLGGLSARSVGFRFFGPANLEWASNWSVQINDARYGLVVTAGADPAIVAHGVYLREGPSSAEVAFVVADRLQAHGIGTILLGQLAAAAQDAGISTLTAVVLPYNRLMLEVFRDCGFTVAVHTDDGEAHVQLRDLSLRRGALTGT